MKISTLKTIQRDDLAKYGQLPDWMNPLLQGINDFINSVGVAVRGKLTFEDNFLCTVKTLAFTSGVAQKIANTIPGTKIKGIIPTSAGGLIIDKFGWSQNSDGSISVTLNFVTGTTATCTIILLLG